MLLRPTRRRCRSGSMLSAAAADLRGHARAGCTARTRPTPATCRAFNQIEGLVVDRGITFGDLAGTIEAFTTAYFGPNIHSRLRPAYFPFTEPSAEFEITCVICEGERLPHLLGHRMDRARRLRHGAPQRVPRRAASIPRSGAGFAFGFGIDRLAQMRHAIPDMRVLLDNDIRFIRQF